MSLNYLLPMIFHGAKCTDRGDKPDLGVHHSRELDKYTFQLCFWQNLVELSNVLSIAKNFCS